MDCPATGLGLTASTSLVRAPITFLVLRSPLVLALTGGLQAAQPAVHASAVELGELDEVVVEVMLVVEVGEATVSV